MEIGLIIIALSAFSSAVDIYFFAIVNGVGHFNFNNCFCNAISWRKYRLSASKFRAAGPQGCCGVFFESETGKISPENPEKSRRRSAALCKLQMFIRKRFMVNFSLS